MTNIPLCSQMTSAIDVSRLLYLNYKTAFVLCSKVRDALFKRVI